MQRGRSWLVRLVKALIVVEAVWLVVVNLLLGSGLAESLINRKPEKFSVSWESARSWFPARLSARGLVYEQHTHTLDIEVRASKAAASVRFLPLLTLRVVLGDVDAHDLAVALVREPPDGPAPTPAKTEPGVRIALEDIEVHGFERFSFNDIAVSGGRPAVSGSFAIQIRGPMALSDLLLDWQDARIDLAEEAIADSISLGFEGAITPFNPKRDKGRALLEKISGQIDIQGESRNLQPLQLLLPDVAWIEKLDGEGDVAAHLILEQGRLQPGSEVDVVASGLELWFLGFAADGSGRVSVDVTENGGARHGQVDVVFEEFGFSRQGDAAPLARGSGLSLRASAQDLGLTAGLEGLDISVDIPDSEVPDVAFLGSHLPPGLGVEVLGGGATLSGHLEANGREEEAKGVFEIRGNRLEGRFRDMDFVGDLAFVTQISGQDLDDFEVELGGTEVRLFNGVFDGEETEVEDGWWMTVAIPKGRGKVSQPMTVSAELDLSMRDTRAIIAAFAEVKRWIRYFAGFLTVRDVAGNASLLIDGPRYSVRDLSLTGDRLEIMAELELEKERNEGIFWGKLGAFSLGMERIGQENDFKLVNGREWYGEQYEARWADRDGGPVEPGAAAAGGS